MDKVTTETEAPLDAVIRLTYTDYFGATASKEMTFFVCGNEMLVRNETYLLDITRTFAFPLGMSYPFTPPAAPALGSTPAGSPVTLPSSVTITGPKYWITSPS